MSSYTPNWHLERTCIIKHACTLTFQPVVGHCETTVERLWLKHFWDHGNLFKIWVVRFTEAPEASWHQIRKQIAIIQGNFRFCSICACLDMSVSSSSWCLGRAAFVIVALPGLFSYLSFSTQ